MLLINVHERKNFNQKQTANHVQACILLSQGINSFEFKSAVLAKKFIQTNGLSNLNIYKLIMSGSETLDHLVDSEMDIWVEMYRDTRSGVIGYTNENTKWVYSNSYFFDNYGPVEIAGNMVHEWLHKIGFDHDFEYSPSRDSSVPYAVGYLLEVIMQRILNGEILQQVDGSSPEPVEIPKPVKVLTCYRSWKTLWVKKTCYWSYQ